MIPGQVVLALLVTWLAVGPLGRYGMSVGVPQVAVIAVWLVAWLTTSSAGARQAVLIGLLLDLQDFSFFGFWTVLLLALVVVTNWSKRRFFSPSSWLESAASLLIALVIAQSAFFLSTRSFDLTIAVTSTITSVLLGLLGYYLVAYRLRLFQQWRGIRVS
jgi:ABC-type nickel/cobalt efflux system permease component RcnA